MILILAASNVEVKVKTLEAECKKLSEELSSTRTKLHNTRISLDTANENTHEKLQKQKQLQAEIVVLKDRVKEAENKAMQEEKMKSSAHKRYKYFSTFFDHF